MNDQPEYFKREYPCCFESGKTVADHLTDICSSLARYMSAKQDEAIRRAINNHLGHDQWRIDEVMPRLTLCSYPDSEIQTITMDGIPIMRIGPVTTSNEEKGRASYLRATRGYQILNDSPENA